MALVSFSKTGAQADQDLIAAPAAGKAIVVERIIFTNSSAAGTVAITNGADGTTTRIIYGVFADGAGFVGDPIANGGTPLPFFTLSAATALKVTTSAGNLVGTIHYHERTL